ncbi:uncharacterized protein VP01_8359g1 [Puccinia sorghi]|uniref:Uncharacterized protein n=1 Tax=Puccinia sorghi TaxID=27349 RepID=A0A0L6UAE0_9BASI|nr:uncharacterized protein VP01_8359g1 [Puccinia sorghi]
MFGLLTSLLVVLKYWMCFLVDATAAVVRATRWQAGKKEYLIGCTQLKQILEQALGLSESIPMTPATIISGLSEMRKECQKRKRDVSKGKPIPPEDMINLKNVEEGDNKVSKRTPKPSVTSKASHKRPRAKQNKPTGESTTPLSEPPASQPSCCSSPLSNKSAGHEDNPQDSGTGESGNKSCMCLQSLLVIFNLLMYCFFPL